ncbi:MAG: outer membrane beta-barrel protein [Desulfovibrio sp.]|jgi:opacity protein-like surface antigen|nr:outer membrane beta-barrel protein [Desulfovibrio sp.]
MKRGIAILAFILILVLPRSALAEGSGMYLAPKFMMTIQDTGRVERSAALAGSSVNEYSQFTLGGALALGYDFWPQQMLPFRAEIEFALRGNSEKTWSGDNNARLSEVKGAWNNSTLFANLFWDFHNDTPFTPYIGAGLGAAFKYIGYDFTTRDGDKFSANDRFTDFAWNVGAGVAYNLNEQFTVDAAYRFVNMGYDEVKARSGGQTYKVGNSPYNNEFMLGLRFAF